MPCNWCPFGIDATVPFCYFGVLVCRAGLLGAQPEVRAVAAEWIPPQIQTSKGKRGAALRDCAQVGVSKSGLLAGGIGRKWD